MEKKRRGLARNCLPRLPTLSTATSCTKTKTIARLLRRIKKRNPLPCLPTRSTPNADSPRSQLIETSLVWIVSAPNSESRDGFLPFGQCRYGCMYVHMYVHTYIHTCVAHVACPAHLYLPRYRPTLSTCMHIHTYSTRASAETGACRVPRAAPAASLQLIDGLMG